jgi:flagellar biosynthesis protein FlhF
LVERLRENEVSKEIIGQLVQRVLNGPAVEDNQAYQRLFEQAIVSMLGEAQPLSINNERKIIMLLGPTGVGKTTTLAKLAAIYSTQTSKKIGLITADTYRIAAVEQLKTYAEILDLPLQIIYSPEEIGEAINRHSNKDLIFIDTPGRNLRQKQQFDELRQLVTLSKAGEIFLAISATTSFSTISNIIESYSFISNYRIILTKIDECTSLGNVLNIRCFTDNPFAYVTTGQSVPDDIEVFQAGKIAQILMGSSSV